MRTFVYVDGFNLYYGALKGRPWKWLDLPALFAKVLQPQHDILTVKYFTARVSGTRTDPSKRTACLTPLHQPSALHPDLAPDRHRRVREEVPAHVAAAD